MLTDEACQVIARIARAVGCVSEREHGVLVVFQSVVQLGEHGVDQRRGLDGRAQACELVAPRGPAPKEIVQSHVAIRPVL
jgi:hypothetical protein